MAAFTKQFTKKPDYNTFISTVRELRKFLLAEEWSEIRPILFRIFTRILEDERMQALAQSGLSEKEAL